MYMCAHIAGQVPGSFSRSDAQVVQTDLTGLGLVLFPLLLIFDLMRQITAKTKLNFDHTKTPKRLPVMFEAGR